MALTENEINRLRSHTLRLIVLRKRFEAVKDRMQLSSIEHESRLWRKFVKANEVTK